MAEKKAKEEARAVERWHPFAELDPFFREWPFPGRMSRLMDELSRGWPAAWAESAFLPAMDVADDDKSYTITVELPGAKRDDVHVELHEGMLTIRGEKKSEREEKKEQRRYVERSYGSFSRSFRLPSDAEVDRLDASFKDGVLTLSIPKTAEAKPRTIAIK